MCAQITAPSQVLVGSLPLLLVLRVLRTRLEIFVWITARIDPFLFLGFAAHVVVDLVENILVHGFIFEVVVAPELAP
jgi:hypothetical protein